MSWDDGDEFREAEEKRKREAAFAGLTGSEAAAWQEGWKCGRSPTGMFDENPYTHRLSKKRKAWHMGWMAGGAIYLQETPPPNAKLSGVASADNNESK